MVGSQRVFGTLLRSCLWKASISSLPYLYAVTFILENDYRMVRYHFPEYFHSVKIRRIKSKEKKVNTFSPGSINTPAYEYIDVPVAPHT